MRYLVQWELSEHNINCNEKIQAERMQLLLKMIRKDKNRKNIIDFGMAIGELNGFLIYENDNFNIVKFILRYIPYIKIIKTRGIFDLDMLFKLHN